MNREKIMQKPLPKEGGVHRKSFQENELNLETINEVERESIVILGAVLGGGHIFYPGQYVIP